MIISHHCQFLEWVLHLHYLVGIITFLIGSILYYLVEVIIEFSGIYHCLVVVITLFNWWYKIFLVEIIT